MMAAPPVTFCVRSQRPPGRERNDAARLRHGMEDQGKYITEIMEAVSSELDERLTVDLSLQDRMAINTALGKAAWRGFLRGMATCAHEANSNWAQMAEKLRAVLPPNVNIANAGIVDVQIMGDDDGTAVEADTWAQFYGEEGGE
jgi:hypothetical protein